MGPDLWGCSHSSCLALSVEFYMEAAEEGAPDAAVF